MHTHNSLGAQDDNYMVMAILNYMTWSSLLLFFCGETLRIRIRQKAFVFVRTSLLALSRRPRAATKLETSVSFCLKATNKRNICLQASRSECRNQQGLTDCSVGTPSPSFRDSLEQCFWTLNTQTKSPTLLDLGLTRFGGGFCECEFL